VEKESITAKETEEEIARLKRLARKTHDVKLRRRYDMIRLFLSKRAKPEIAAILDISLTQVYLIVNLYKESGIEGLGLKRPTGRHRKLTDEQENELCSIITEKLPKEVGLDPYCNWTAPLACKYVKDHYHGNQVSAHGLGKSPKQVVEMSRRGVTTERQRKMRTKTHSQNRLICRKSG